MKVLTIVGARPQFIKAATISRVIKNLENVQEVLVHTGQHYDQNMSDIFFEEMDIPWPDYNLEVSGLSHGAMTGQMLEKIEKVILEERPDWVLVYGDTNSTLAAALAASKLHFKIAHVEAGLRSFNMKMPEEQNRILTDRLSTILFCPTEQAVKNLNNESYALINNDYFNVGDVMYDAALFYAEEAAQRGKIKVPVIDYVLVTCHRAENTDDEIRITAIINALNKLHQKIEVILPIHPRTKRIIEKLNLELKFRVIDPVGYFDMINLIKNSKFVMTDSGGLQKEAYFFSKFCLTLRDQTEWVELVESGVNVLVGADKDKILSEADQILQANIKFPINLYGDGSAAKKIINHILNWKK